MQNGKVFFIADTHFSHSLLLEEEHRPYPNLKMHDEDLIKKWNSVVSHGDTVYFLGDFAMTNKEKTTEIVQRLQGTKHLILGNHDTRKLSHYLTMGFATVNTWALFKKEQATIYLSHKPLEHGCPITGFGPDDYNIHGHVHSGNHRSSSMENINANPHQYFCVSVEQINFTPIEFDELSFTWDVRESKIKECFYCKRNSEDWDGLDLINYPRGWNGGPIHVCKDCEESL